MAHGLPFIKRTVPTLLVCGAITAALAGRGEPARGGTVFLGDNSRSIGFVFADRAGGRGADFQDPSFSATIDETDETDAGSARVRATYESVLDLALTRTAADVTVDRNGRPAASQGGITLQFVVLDDPATINMSFNAEYDRLAGDADPAAASGLFRLTQRFRNPTPRQENLEFFEFDLGAEGNETAARSREFLLQPGEYTFEFVMGLPQIPPDVNSSEWVAGTATDRSDRLTYEARATFTTVTPGTPVIPLPPAAFSGGGMLAGVAAFGWLRGAVRHRRALRLALRANG